MYDITLMTYLLAFGHFFSEIVIFKTAKLGVPVLSPVVVSGEPMIILLKFIIAHG